MNVLDFLAARLDEDEALAEVLRGSGDGLVRLAGERILASAHSKRGVVDEYRGRVVVGTGPAGLQVFLAQALMTFAEEYMTHPDFRREWSEGAFSPAPVD